MLMVLPLSLADNHIKLSRVNGVIRGVKLQLIQSIVVGLQRRWKRSFATFLSVLGAVWLLTEIVTRAFSPANDWLTKNGTLYLFTAFGLAVTGFLIATYEARSVTFTIPNTGTKLTLKFADIFKHDADWLIGVNEFFDSTVGTIVADTSLHGQVILKVFNGDSGEFRSVVDRALTGINYEAVERVEGQRKRYPLGTTINIARGHRKIYLMALTKTDTTTHRATSSVPILWDALDAAFKMVDAVGNGAPLALPLIGNGRASLNIPPQHLLRLITLRLTELGRTYDLPRNITITLAEECFEHLDLVEIKRGWSVV